MQEEYLKEKLSDYTYFEEAGGRIRKRESSVESCIERIDLKGSRENLGCLKHRMFRKQKLGFIPSRIANWTIFKDKKNKGSEIILINTHFDHKGRESRHQAALLLKSRIQNLKKMHG